MNLAHHQVAVAVDDHRVLALTGIALVAFLATVAGPNIVASSTISGAESAAAGVALAGIPTSTSISDNATAMAQPGVDWAVCIEGAAGL